MKGILKFNLDEPEEVEAFEAAMKGLHNKMLIETLYDSVFRPHMKYYIPILPDSISGMQELSEEHLEIIHAMWLKVQDHFFNRFE